MSTEKLNVGLLIAGGIGMIAFISWRVYIFFSLFGKVSRDHDDGELECLDYPERGCPFDDETTKGY